MKLLLLLLVATTFTGDAYNAGFSRASFMRKLSTAAPAALAAGAILPPQVAIAADDSVFLGRYSDPKHPGGIRDISLVPGAQKGAYRLASVKGGGGIGEPASYELPAVIIERGKEASIIIDFSVEPKRGPRDFVGVYDAKAGGIVFTRAGTLWSKQP